jgi:carbon-monoxide dehydrogenase iron sulfur subunit
MGALRVPRAEVKVHLEIHAEKCTGCRICENFCSFHHEGAVWPARSRITIVAQSDDGPFIPTVCRQCEDASCAVACPVEAITRDERTGAWVVDVEECIGCFACVEACPFEGIVFDNERGIPLKCDLCGGEPECAVMCPTGAIQVVL